MFKVGVSIFQAAMALWPKGLPAALNNRATWTTDHLPSRAAGMPRSSKPDAMARNCLKVLRP